jgi:hypothetical protein
VERLDGTALRAWAGAATRALAAARARVDAVNVFPVPDSDTGTNVHLTVAGGAEAVAAAARGARDGGRAEPGAGEVAAVFARGALLSARGNSGVIVSQYLAGLAAALPPSAGPLELADALGAAARSAREAVADPQEGTVLTLAQVVADAAVRSARAGATLADVLGASVGEARGALARVSAEHPVLRAAHVVDAGACALLVLLDALARVAADRGDDEPDLGWLPEPPAHVHGHSGAGADGGAYEVMLLVRAPGQHGDVDLAPVLRARMQDVGDSVAVVGSAGLWHVHVHTDDPARAITDAAVGSREQVVVRLLAGRTSAGLPAELGVVACTGSVDLAHALASLGAVTLVRCDGAGVSERHLVRAVTDTGAARVVVLPGDAATAATATAAVPALRAAGTTLEVAPACDELRVTVAALALAGSAPGGSDARVAASARSLDRVRAAVVVDPDPRGARAALDALLAEPGRDRVPETLTLLTGRDVPAAVRTELEAYVAERHPDLALLGAGPADGVPSYWWGVE